MDPFPPCPIACSISMSVSADWAYRFIEPTEEGTVGYGNSDLFSLQSPHAANEPWHWHPLPSPLPRPPFL